MTGGFSSRYAEFVTSRSRLVVLVVLLATALVGAGLAVNDIESAGIGEFEVDAPETEAATFVGENYASDDAVRSQIVVRERGGNVLTRESLLAGLDFQRAVRNDSDVAATLAGDGLLGIENIVAAAAVHEERLAAGEQPGGRPTLDQQRDALAERTEEEIEALLAAVLDPETETPGVPAETAPVELLPRSYEPGTTEAEARLTLLTQVDDSDGDGEPEAAYAAQVAIADTLSGAFDDAFVFGQGISNDRSGQAVGDSFAIITPVALLLVLGVLGIAYRDPLDIALGFFGIGLVLVWLFGTLAWLTIPTSQIFIAVPFLLIGLSIDYALHVVMRYREAREGTLGIDGGRPEDSGRDGEDSGRDGEESGRGGEDSERDDSAGRDPGVRVGMALGLGSVVLALAAATFSTGVGFLSNVVSPLPAIQDFAVLSAAGILATFVVFGLLLPALKVELDGAIERRLGRSRRRSPFGVGGGVVNRALSGVAAVAARAPVAIIVIALVLATAGAVGATTIDTEFNEADFLPRDSPDWAGYLPGPFQPGEYTIADDFAYLSENFRVAGEGGQAQVLIRASDSDSEGLTDGQVLGAIDRASGDVPADSNIDRLPDDSPAIEGPHTVIREVAAANATVAAAVDERDTTDDGLPDEDLATFYDLLFGADPEAASEVASRNAEGEVTSLRLVVSVRGNASAQAIRSDVAALGTDIEGDAPTIRATATSSAVTTAVLQDALLSTLVQALAVTLVVILAFLTALFWVRYRSLTLGPIVLAPVVASLCWLLGAMALLDIPFNSETAVITSLAIGLGVDYSIHAGERFVAERERRDSLPEALRATITGTGGALLASAGTTAGGFGVLALSLAPPIRRFGLVTGSAIVLALVACLTVLPCLLVVRERIGRWRDSVGRKP